jgi:hypothetical protein
MHVKDIYDQGGWMWLVGLGFRVYDIIKIILLNMNFNSMFIKWKFNNKVEVGEH